jgi:long-chain acyl-CoA synthetase
MRTFYEWIFQQPEVNLEKTVLVTFTNTYTLSDLKKEIEKYRELLQQEGSLRRKKVGLLVPSIPAYLALTIAINQCGGIVVPLSWQYRKEDLTSVLNITAPHIIFTVKEHQGFLFGEEVKKWAKESGQQTVFYESEDSFHWEKIEIAGLPRPIEQQEIDLIGCSSGSTGVPKGIMLTTEALQNWSDNLLSVTQLSKQDSVFQTLNPTAPYGLVWMLSCLRTGLKTIATEYLDIPKIIPLLDQHQCNKVNSTPSVFQGIYTFIKHMNPAILNRFDLCIFAGEIIREELIERIAEGISCGFLGIYGLSELGLLMYTPDDLRNGIEWEVFSGVDFKIEQETEDGIGEVIFRSPKAAFTGYYQRPDLTKDVYSEDGWFTTGDLVKRTENNRLKIVGRKKDMIKKGGQPVFPAEIENFLNRHPSVSQSAVVGIPHPAFGEEIVAFIVPNGTCDAHELRMFCSSQIANFKVPDRFITIQEIPVVQGKTDKVTLRKLAQRRVK